GDRARPDFLRTYPRISDRGGARHAGSLWSVGVQLLRMHHADAVQPPIFLLTVIHRTPFQSGLTGRHLAFSAKYKARCGAKVESDASSSCQTAALPSGV